MKNSICLILVIIVITCKMSQAQSWTTTGDTISTTGTIKGASLNITGSCVKLTGILTDTNTDLLGINKLGKVSPITGLALNTTLYPPSAPDPCDTSHVMWYHQIGGSLVTTTCNWVGVGEAGIANLPDAPLSISYNGSNTQFSVVNPTSLTDIFTIDKSGNTVISGLAGIGTATSSLTSLNVAGRSGQYTTMITTADTSNIYNIMSEFTTTNAASKIGLAVHIAAGSSNYDVFDVYGNGNGYYKGNIGIGIQSPNAQLNINAPPTSSIPAFAITNSSANVFTVDKSGNAYSAGTVLIQTAINTYPLNVGGTIWCNEIKVCLSGCDFVFDKDYKLMPLEELEKYLELNHHLPGIAPAKDMETNDGVALGKMNSQLLQKVEELTLYTIELKKQLDDMQAEINKMKDSK